MVGSPRHVGCSWALVGVGLRVRIKQHLRAWLEHVTGVTAECHRLQLIVMQTVPVACCGICADVPCAALR